VLDYLALAPEDWGDYSDAASRLNPLSIMTVVEDCPEEPTIKYVKFIEYAGSVGRAFESAPLKDFMALTVVSPPDEDRWYVWGLSDGYFPPRSEVMRG